MRPDQRVSDNDPFSKCHARNRAELRVAAFNELPEPHRCETRGHGVRLWRLELCDVTGQRAALRFVVLADVHDERGRGHVVDEVIADRLGLPRVAIGLIPAQTCTEDAFGEQMARGNVIGMSIGPVRDGDDSRPGRSYEACNGTLMVWRCTDRAVRQAQVDAPRGTEHFARRLRLREPLLHGSVAAHLTRCQIAQSHTMTKSSMLGNDAPDADLDVIRVRSDRQDRKSTRLNSSHSQISYAVFCLKKKKNKQK